MTAPVAASLRTSISIDLACQARHGPRVTFDRLFLWRDPVPRPGPENMAVDDWLLETAGDPVLRIYEWQGDWVSLGYFAKIRDARGMMRNGEAGLVRRATGGGIADHRVDRTYSLVVPRRQGLAELQRVLSYRVIHEALAQAMKAFGVAARLIAEDQEGDSAACFEQAVAWDIVDAAGRKLAGAGQRRTRRGLLHQGSVVLPGQPGGLFGAHAARLASKVETIHREPSREELAARIEKFANPAWLERW